MQVQKNISLQPYNTFGIDVLAQSFAKFSSVGELDEILAANDQKETFILGGGSNILFTKDYHGIVLKNELTGVEELTEDEEYIYIKAGAGENWHQLVLYCVQRNWAGIENLSLIPGNVGATPIQNIGAYGVEMQDVFESLEAFDMEERKVVTFTLNDCEFGYRNSIFKTKYKGRFIILNLKLRLSKEPIFHTEYGAIQQELEKMKIAKPNIAAISQAVINIRSSKLPDPKQIGNAGSFFKNPSVSKLLFENLKSNFSNIIGHENIDGTVKLAAGWLIEQCGWKGFRKGDAGCYPKQALVLVNFGNATGKEIYDLSEEILQSVKEKFGIELEREVNIL